MIKLLKNYIQNFIIRAGSYVFMASFFTKIISFFASWVVLQFVSNKELGIVLFAYNIVVFLSPMSDFGLHQGLLRYGALLKTKNEKDVLFVYVFKKGIWAGLFWISLVVAGSYIFQFQFETTPYYLRLLSVSFIPVFVFGIVKIQFRLRYQNKQFAFAELVYNIILLVSIGLLSFLFKDFGYALALIIGPTIAAAFLVVKLKINFYKSIKPSVVDRQFWKYGFFASLSSVSTQLLSVIDILLIGYLLSDAEMVTTYKYISLLPISLIFLPMIFVNTDFVFFTENIYKKKYIMNYCKSYLVLFTSISLVFCLFSWLFSTEILSFFDSDFAGFKTTFMALVFGVCGILMFRGLYGNLLSSIGKTSFNFYITGLALLVNVIANFYLIPKFGILGAALTSACLMWGTSIVTIILFWWYYPKFLENKK